MHAVDDLTRPAGPAPLADAAGDLCVRLAAHAAAADAAGRLADEDLAALRTSGLLAAAVPAAYGGLGCTAAETNRLVAQVAEADASAAIVLFQHFAVSARIAEWGSPAQRASLLPWLAAGHLAASAWSETGAGADKRTIRTRARRTPGGWTLDGTKAFATGASLADLYLVLAQTAEPTGGHLTYGSDGQTFFLVAADTAGLTADPGRGLTGMRASATGGVNLRQCRVPHDAVLGPEGGAATVIAGVRGSGATLGAVAVGIAEAALGLAVAHLRARDPGPGSAARYRLADLGCRVAQARAIVESAGRREGADPGTLTLQSKLAASQAAEEVCLEVQRLLGSTGFRDTHPVNRLCRDARAVGLMGPTNDLCRELLSAEGPS